MGETRAREIASALFATVSIALYPSSHRSIDDMADKRTIV